MYLKDIIRGVMMMRKKFLHTLIALSLSAVITMSSVSTAIAGDLPSYLAYVDNVQNTKYQTSEIRGLVFPVIKIDAGNNTFWKNMHGGTDYVLVYGGPYGNYKAAGYTDKQYPNGQRYPSFDSWVTPDGVTIDYLGSFLDAN